MNGLGLLVHSVGSWVKGAKIRLNVLVGAVTAKASEFSEISKYRQAHTPSSTHLVRIGSLAVGVRGASDARAQSLDEEHTKLALKVKALA